MNWPYLELDGHEVVNTLLNPNSTAYRLLCGKVLSESETYQQDLFSLIIEQAISLDKKLALYLEYSFAWMSYGSEKKRSRDVLEGEDAGKCWDESHDEVEMDREHPTGYPYLETWPYCLFFNGEDEDVLEKLYRKLDTY